MSIFRRCVIIGVVTLVALPIGILLAQQNESQQLGPTKIISNIEKIDWGPGPWTEDKKDDTHWKKTNQRKSSPNNQFTATEITIRFTSGRVQTDTIGPQGKVERSGDELRLPPPPPPPPKKD